MGQVNTFLEGLNELDKMETGSGGFIGKVKLETGYKIFVTGLSNEDSFFPFIVGDEVSQQEALKNAKGELVNQGSPTRNDGKLISPTVSVQLTLYKNDVLGAGMEKASKWNNDRVWTTPKYTMGYTEVIKPKLVEMVNAGKPLKWGEMWGRVTFIKDPDPKAKPKADQNGEMKDPLVAYLADVFANENEAELAATGTERVGERPTNGNGNSADATWNAVKGDKDFKSALVEAAGSVKPKPKKEAALIAVASEWEVANPEAHLDAMKELAGIK